MTTKLEFDAFYRDTLIRVGEAGQKRCTSLRDILKELFEDALSAQTGVELDP